MILSKNAYNFEIAYIRKLLNGRFIDFGMDFNYNQYKLDHAKECFLTRYDNEKMLPPVSFKVFEELFFRCKMQNANTSNCIRQMKQFIGLTSYKVSDQNAKDNCKLHSIDPFGLSRKKLDYGFFTSQRGLF